MVFRILAYSLPSDDVDEYIQIGETTIRECLICFYRFVIAAFGSWYLRSPNEHDIARLLHTDAERGFPSMMGSIDFMYWKWRDFPSAWHNNLLVDTRSPP